MFSIATQAMSVRALCRHQRILSKSIVDRVKSSTGSAFYSAQYVMTSPETLEKLKSNAERANSLLENLRKEYGDLRQLKIESRKKTLDAENVQLRMDITKALEELVKLETANGKVQIPVPGQDSAPNSEPAAKAIVETSAPVSEQLKAKPKKEAKPKAAPKKVEEVEAPLDVGRLDFRIGRIIEVAKHPDADSLYVEKIDCGEAAPRTVVSGLVKHIPIEEMQNRLVVVMCNLKPAKMRGITSEAMVMCASSAEKVEILSPPSGAVPGDLVHCEGYTRNPDAQLNPKKKIFETCAPDLLTNDKREACYKGANLIVPEKGNIVSQTLTGVNVR